MFEPAHKFMFTATKKYQLDAQALGSLTCEKARQLIVTDYPNFVESWEPQKYRAGNLTIKATGSSGGELYMRTQEFLLKLEKLELPQRVQQIKIVKV